MRTVFSVLITYIIFLIFGAAACAALVMLFYGCLNFVVGQPLNLFSASSFLFGLKVGIPVIAMVLPMFMFFSLIRHSHKNKIVGSICICILSLGTWIGLMPLFYTYYDTYVKSAQPQSNHLSSGYFRKSQDKIYYFTYVAPDGKVDGLAIPENLEMNEDFSTYEILNGSRIEMPDADYFSDILVKQTIDVPVVLNQAITDFAILTSAGIRAHKAGFIQYLLFCLIIVALLSCCSLLTFSQWRLINVLLVFVGTTITVKLNAICFGRIFYGSSWVNFIYDINTKLYEAGAGFGLVEQPVFLYINLLIIVVFALMGIINKAVSKTKPQEDD